MNLNNSALSLSRYESEKLVETGHLTLLYRIEAPEISQYEGTFRFDWDTHAIFPAIAVKNDAGSFDEDMTGFTTALKDKLHDKDWSFFILNAGKFWNYLGDGTHCSRLVRTPFGLVKDHVLQAENRYSREPLFAQVTNIGMTRIREEKDAWVWELTLQRIAGPQT